MIKNKHLMMAMMMILLMGLLAACGSKEDKAEGEAIEDNVEVFPSMNDVPLGLNKISFEELIEKLDNKESFWLVTIDYDRETDAKEIGDKVGLEQIYDEELKEWDMGAYFVDLYESYDEHDGYLISEEEFSEKYSHPENDFLLAMYAHEDLSGNMFLVTNHGVRDLNEWKSDVVVVGTERLEEWYDDPWKIIDDGESLYSYDVREDVHKQTLRNRVEYKDLMGIEIE